MGEELIKLRTENLWFLYCYEVESLRGFSIRLDPCLPAIGLYLGTVARRTLSVCKGSD